MKHLIILNTSHLTDSSVIEINLGIIIACAPIIPHFFKRKQKTPSPIRVYSPTPPTPPAKEISYNLKAPPSSRIGHYPLIPLSGRALARSGAMSPDREKYTELEDHSLVLPMKMERAELSAYRTVSYYEVDTVPTKGLPTRWIRSSRRM